MMTPDENGSGATCKHHEGLETAVESNREDINRNADDIDDLRDMVLRVYRRPPVWTTIVISALVGLCTAAVTVAVMSYRAGPEKASAAAKPDRAGREPAALVLDE